jgi:DNA-directed RNA polymerase specialized sigma24 family protein
MPLPDVLPVSVPTETLADHTGAPPELVVRRRRIGRPDTDRPQLDAELSRALPRAARHQAVVTHREVARGGNRSDGPRAVSPCVMDDHAGGRPVPPDAPAAPPLPVVDLYARHVVGALAAVTSAERECIELTYFDDMSLDEVAVCCDISPAAVDDRLTTGLDGMLWYLRRCADREAAAAAHAGGGTRTPTDCSTGS